MFRFVRFSFDFLSRRSAYCTLFTHEIFTYLYDIYSNLIKFRRVISCGQNNKSVKNCPIFYEYYE